MDVQLQKASRAAARLLKTNCPSSLKRLIDRSPYIVELLCVLAPKLPALVRLAEMNLSGALLALSLVEDAFEASAKEPQFPEALKQARVN